MSAVNFEESSSELTPSTSNCKDEGSYFVDSSTSATASTGRSDSIVSYRFDPIIQSGDFGQVIQLISERRLTNDEKYFLLKHHFPNKGYNFPVHNFGDYNRRFRNKWLDEYNGLVYVDDLIIVWG